VSRQLIVRVVLGIVLAAFVSGVIFDGEWLRLLLILAVVAVVLGVEVWWAKRQLRREGEREDAEAVRLAQAKQQDQPFITPSGSGS
jgi:uncharacterized membrane protein